MSERPTMTWAETCTEVLIETGRLRDELAALNAHCRDICNTLLTSGVEVDGAEIHPNPRADWLAYARKVAAECVRLRADLDAAGARHASYLRQIGEAIGDSHAHGDYAPPRVVADDECPGAGECHGCMTWCPVCADDAAKVCPDRDCDVHHPADEDDDVREGEP